MTKANTLEPTHFVGIGASAGGLEIIEAFFTRMPAKNGLAFIIVQHLSPDYKSLMVELLSKIVDEKGGEPDLNAMEKPLFIIRDKIKIGNLLLNKYLEIRKYFPEITNIFNIIKKDMEFPLSHLSQLRGFNQPVSDRSRKS